MSKQVEVRVRALIGHVEGDSIPSFIGATDAGMWEVLPDEDWQKIVRGWKETFTGDWQSYDYREVFLTFPASVDLFAAPTIPVEMTEDEA